MRNTLPASFFVLLLTPLFAAGAGSAAPRPAVVELFTSEGCSSCPPAEAYVGELAARPDVLALSFHVDYWDDLGWRDRYGIPEATPRQQAYAGSLHRPSVYTPQVVIDGEEDFVGGDRARIGHALDHSRSGVPIALALQDGAVLSEVSPQPGADGDAFLVAYRREAVSAIGRGENAGRTLTEHNIVRRIITLGRYSGSAQSYRTESSSLPPDATDVALIIQTRDHGRIIAAASRSLR